MQDELSEDTSQRKAAMVARRQRDLKRLNDAGFEVIQNSDNLNQLAVTFKGPELSAYKDGKWVVQVYLPDQYPLKAPSLGFVNKIFHPNIDPRY